MSIIHDLRMELSQELNGPDDTAPLPPCRLESIDQVFKALQVISMHEQVLWFRGQNEAYPHLEPGVFRDRSGASENDLNLSFRARCGLRHAKPPERENLPGWLFLAQHYGLPTRILDWSESVLVALFFATREPVPDGEGGALYCLDPCLLTERSLREQVKAYESKDDMRERYRPYFPEKAEYLETLYNETRVLYPDHPEVLTMARKAFHEHNHGPWGPDHQAGAFAVMAEAIDARQAVQQGTFTIHGRPHCLNVEDFADCLLEITLDEQLKAKVKKSLKKMGMMPSVLFPDIEHLHEDL